MPPRFTPAAAAIAREVVPLRPFALSERRVPSISLWRVPSTGRRGGGEGLALTDSFIRSYDSSENNQGEVPVAMDQRSSRRDAVRWAAAGFLLALTASVVLLLAPW